MFEEINEILCIHKRGPFICCVDSRDPLLKSTGDIGIRSKLYIIQSKCDIIIIPPVDEIM